MAHLQEAAVKQINEICERYKDEKTPLMMILSDIQKEYGYIPLEVQELVSEKTGISVAEIYGVGTFYSFFSLMPAVTINGKVYPKMTVDAVPGVIAEYRAMGGGL